MDFDDDRILNTDTSDNRRLNAFKVPKKLSITKSSFDKLSLDSTEFKDTIFSKVASGFKSPSSLSSFKVLSAYNICNFEVESLFNKRKQYFKKEYSPQSSAEYFGFIYISNLSELRRIAHHGRIKNGNLNESVLGQAEMGVSVCQYSDIYHHGDNKNYPRTGFLLIVKYMRGRVCYVVEDNNPMEPQPNYDCHMSKVYNHESFPSVGRAFHTTQVYLYEYSDDLDLIEEPSHVIPWAAVEFIWGGPLLHKLVSVPIVVVNESLYKDPSSKIVDKRIRLLSRPTGSPSQRIKQSYTDCTPILSTQLQLKLSTTKEESSSDNVVLDIPVTILSYHTQFTAFAPLMSSSWQVCELIEWISFEQEFLKPLINNPLSDGFSLNDVFNKRITLNRNRETMIAGSDDSSRFVNYLRMVVNDPSRDRAKMARLIEHFHETKTVGRLRLNDTSASLLYVFPDCSLSQNFGIPSVKTLDVNYLHILLITEKSLAYQQYSDLFDKFLEIEHKTNLLKLCDSQTLESNDQMLSMYILKQCLKNQNHIQKSKLREMCGLVTNGPLVFEKINFDPTVSIMVPTEETVVSPLNTKDSADTINGHNSESEEVDNRPYDPTENMLGLSEVGSLKRVNRHRKSEFGIEEPPVKVLKREEKQLDLNNKLLELFAQIEDPDVNESIDVSILSAVEEQPCAFDRMSPEPIIFCKSLDRNRFQTQYRHGVSVYVPHEDTEEHEERTDINRPKDIDLRFQDPKLYQFNYFDDIMQPNGVNR